MTEFLNYTVDLFMKDGSKSSGLINSVDKSQITLSDVIHSGNPNQRIPSFKVDSSTIANLKVIKLSPEMIKRATEEVKSKNSKSKKKSDNNNNNNNKNNGEKKKEQGISDETSDVNSIKASNEFDFAANLAMFDKQSVFADFQKKDQVNPQERLVDHNRLKKKDHERTQDDKYRNDEMVLDSTRGDNWHLIGNTGDRKDSLRNASVTGRSTPIQDSVVNKKYQLIFSNNGTNIPMCSPVQLVEIERIASTKFGISGGIMCEIFATNLSNLICQRLLGGSSRLHRNNHNLPPLVVLLIGSERCSSRALAVGRHLSNHGVRVLAYIINQELSSDDLYLQQQQLFELAGGKVITSSVPEFLHILNDQLQTPVELIIDALQGYDDHLEDVFYESNEFQLVTDIINWCNEPKQQSKVMSLDIPSGIDGGAGTINDDGLFIVPKSVISMGLPVAGILHAYRNEYLKCDDDHKVDHLIVDIGIPNNVYHNKSNLRKFDRIWHDSESIIKALVQEKD